LRESDSIGSFDDAFGDFILASVGHDGGNATAENQRAEQVLQFCHQSYPPMPSTLRRSDFNVRKRRIYLAK
jgi:hypothetical protein